MIEKLQAHYGFERMPFGRNLAPGMLHRHDSHNQAVARISWCIAERSIGVVTGAQGQRWYEVTVTGMGAHAGPTPMERRKDALLGASRMVDAVNRIGMSNLPNACATVGMMEVRPNSRNTIPGSVFLTIDLPRNANFRFEATTASTTCCTRWMCDAKQARMTLPSA